MAGSRGWAADAPHAARPSVLGSPDWSPTAVPEREGCGAQTCPIPAPASRMAFLAPACCPGEPRLPTAGPVWMAPPLEGRPSLDSGSCGDVQVRGSAPSHRFLCLAAPLQGPSVRLPSLLLQEALGSHKTEVMVSPKPPSMPAWAPACVPVPGMKPHCPPHPSPSSTSSREPLKICQVTFLSAFQGLADGPGSSLLVQPSITHDSTALMLRGLPAPLRAKARGQGWAGPRCPWRDAVQLPAVGGECGQETASGGKAQGPPRSPGRRSLGGQSWHAFQKLAANCPEAGDLPGEARAPSWGRPQHWVLPALVGLVSWAQPLERRKWPGSCCWMAPTATDSHELCHPRHLHTRPAPSLAPGQHVCAQVLPREGPALPMFRELSWEPQEGMMARIPQVPGSSPVS